MNCNLVLYSKPGGLEVDNNQVSDRDVSTCRNKLLKLSRFSRLLRQTYGFCWSRYLKSRLIQLRLGNVQSKFFKVSRFS
jgi:hypothetical protein